MNPIVINGTVLCDNITGIPRYVYENVVRLDKLIYDRKDLPQIKAIANWIDTHCLSLIHI